jgi:hypothetical protein
MDLCKIYFIGFTVMLTSALLIYLFGGKATGKKIGSFFSDILKENDEGRAKWSQGRFYLMLSLMFYFFVITLLSIKAVKPNSEIKNESFEMVISALQWIIALFAGYVFGAKGLKVLDSIFKYRTGSTRQNQIISEEIQNTVVDSQDNSQNQQSVQQDPAKGDVQI